MKSNESELENGRRLTTGTGTSVCGGARGFLAGNERDGAEECVVDAHLQAGDGADGNGVVAIGEVQARCVVGVAGLVIEVGRNAEVDVERRGAIALELIAAVA